MKILKLLKGINSIAIDTAPFIYYIEVLDVTQRFSLSDIVNVNIENLPLEAVK